MTDSLIFTDHLKNPSDSELEEMAFAAIRRHLKRLLKQRGLWSLPPSLLGVGGKSWDDESLLELGFECYCHVFVGMSEKNPGGKREYWRKKIADGQNIEKIANVSIRNFVHDRQENSSPEEAAVFKNLKKAIKIMIAEEQIKMLGNGKRVTAESKIGIVDATAVEIQRLKSFVTDSEDWQPALRIIRKFGKTATQATKSGLEATQSAGEVPFIFGDMKQVLSESSYMPADNKSDDPVAVHSEETSEFLFFDRIVRDTNSYETRVEAMDEIESEIHLKIDDLDRRKQIKDRLHSIVDFISSRLRESGFGESVSQSLILEELQLARSTVSDDMNILRELANQIVTTQ